MLERAEHARLADEFRFKPLKFRGKRKNAYLPFAGNGCWNLLHRLELWW
jgi:hypothetical protein